MEDCFRFMINVDQCLNMSSFDIFFYKLESRHKFHLNQVQLFGDSFGTSLRHAVLDIRTYLDKYPYHVGDCQLIVTMRDQFKKQKSCWKETMLYRLLQINYELQQAHIYISSKERSEKVLNLIMLYDADFSAGLPALDDYMGSRRLGEECTLLLRELGIGEQVDPERPVLEQALQEYLKRETCDAAVAWIFTRFLMLSQGTETFLELEDDIPILDDQEAVQQNSGMRTALIAFLKDQFVDYQIFETLIDRNSRRDNILGLLRVVDFINMSAEKGPAEGHGIVTLSERCRENWKKVCSDPDLESRYASMLYLYRLGLRNAAEDLERFDFDFPSAKKMPQEAIPADREIHSSDGVFSGNQSREEGYDLKDVLQNFMNTKFPARTLLQKWDEVYRQIKHSLDQMEVELKRYAGDLSRQYTGILEKRKKEALCWQTSSYTAPEDMERRISHLELEREERLKQLKSPHMNPSLKFQDQLNMENALEIGNMNIRFYIHCIRAVTVGNMLALFVLVALLTVGHYSFLQPYVYLDGFSLMSYLGYIGGLLILMLFSWRMPHRFFYGRIRSCVGELQDYMDKYIKGYFEKADYFCTYINLLNQLDYITRYHRLQIHTQEKARSLAQGYLWHKTQIKVHLSKLQFFQGLMELCDVENVNLDKAQRDIPAVNGERVDDVVDSPLYWPQG